MARCKFELEVFSDIAVIVILALSAFREQRFVVDCMMLVSGFAVFSPWLSFCKLAGLFFCTPLNIQ